MTNPTFNYDPKEDLGDGFLIPVYFGKHVLVKYLYDPRVSVQFASETYGTVYFPDHYMSFGINSKGAVIAWLGDLKELPHAEKIHWYSENVAPQKDVMSEFFDAQIKAEFTQNPIGIQAINAIDNWNAAFARKHGIGLYKPKSFEERLDDVRRYRRIIIQSEDDFVRFVSELNEIINENVDTAAIKAFLNSKSMVATPGSRGNKLIELVYTGVLGDTTNIIEPFFLLYDLRLWADHNIGDEKLKDVAAKLGITDLTDFEGILTALLIGLRDAAETLKETYGDL
jgi:hypothetical protein